MSSGLNVDAKLLQEEQGQQNKRQQRQIQTENTGYNNQKAQQQQQQEQQPDYKIDKLLPKQNQKQKLIEQNIKLKTQIYELAIQLDEILQKDKSKKKKYGSVSLLEDQDQVIKSKRLELKKQQLQIVQVKNRIFQLKRQLDSVFNNQIVQEREDKLKHIKMTLQQLQNQKDGLIKVKKGQTKAIKTIKNQQEFRQKIQKTHKEVMRIKQQTQKLMQKALQARKNEVNSHERYVLKKQKIRELQNKLAVNAKNMKEKQKSKNGNISYNNNNNNSSKDMISNQLIAELEEQIKKLQVEKKEGEKVWQDKIRNIEIQLQFKRAEQQKKQLILRQKQKQLKLNEIRIRQLRKLVKQNIIQQNTKKAEDMDMSQYRHRRNIRYMEK